MIKNTIPFSWVKILRRGHEKDKNSIPVDSFATGSPY